MQITITLDPMDDDELRAALNFLAVYQPRVLHGVTATAALVESPTHPTAGPVMAAAAPFAPPEDNPAVFIAGAATSTTAPEAAQVFSTPASAPPAPVSVAPVAAVPPVPAGPTTPAPGVELDAKGLPWDARIHAKSSTGPGGVKNADGTWRAKRGINDGAFVAQVEAELRAAMGAPSPRGPVAGGRGDSDAPPAAVPVPPVPPVAAIPVPPGAGPVIDVGARVVGPEEITTFPQIMKKISGLRVGQFPAMSQDELTAILTQAGLPSLPTLASRADLIPAVNAGIDALMLTKQH